MDIRDAIGVSFSWSQFVKEMEKRGYTWKLNRKYEDFYHHLRMEMDEYRRLKRSLRVLKSYTDYEEDLYEEAV